MDFSDRLKKVRFSKTLTQQQMADLLGMSLRMYGYYENGEYSGEDNRVGKYLHKLAQLEKGIPDNNKVTEIEESESDKINNLREEMHRMWSEIEFLKWKIKEMQEDVIEQKLDVDKKIKDIWVTYEKKKEPLKVQGKRSS